MYAVLGLYHGMETPVHGVLVTQDEFRSLVKLIGFCSDLMWNTVFFLGEG